MISELKPKEFIIIENTNIDYNNAISMNEFQLKSYEKLFQSCLTNVDEIANEFNLNRFLNEYANKCAEIELYKLEILKESLKDEYDTLMNGKYIYFIDYTNRTIKVIKK